MTHTITFTLTPEQETGWALALASANDARKRDDSKAVDYTLDDLFVETLTFRLGNDYARQARAVAAAPVAAKLLEVSEQDFDAIKAIAIKEEEAVRVEEVAQPQGMVARMANFFGFGNTNANG